MNSLRENNFENNSNSDINFVIECSSQFSIESHRNNQLNENLTHSNLIINNFIKDNNELKILNDILEREINLLKSLILINNLNLNNSENKPCKIIIFI